MQGQTGESSAHVLYIAIHRRRAFVREIIFALGELRKTDLRFLLYLGKYPTHLSQQTDGQTFIYGQQAKIAPLGLFFQNTLPSVFFFLCCWNEEPCDFFLHFFEGCSLMFLVVQVYWFCQTVSLMSMFSYIYLDNVIGQQFKLK